jgi:hypothetical protein
MVVLPTPNDAALVEREDGRRDAFLILALTNGDLHELGALGHSNLLGLVNQFSRYVTSSAAAFAAAEADSRDKTIERDCLVS